MELNGFILTKSNYQHLESWVLKQSMNVIKYQKRHFVQVNSFTVNLIVSHHDVVILWNRVHFNYLMEFLINHNQRLHYLRDFVRFQLLSNMQIMHVGCWNILLQLAASWNQVNQNEYLYHRNLEQSWNLWLISVQYSLTYVKA